MEVVVVVEGAGVVVVEVVLGIIDTMLHSSLHCQDVHKRVVPNY